jgi:hypothetical protein
MGHLFEVRLSVSRTGTFRRGGDSRAAHLSCLDAHELAFLDAPAGAAVSATLPAIIADAGDQAARRFLEFFAATDLGRDGAGDPRRLGNDGQMAVGFWFALHGFSVT